MSKIRLVIEVWAVLGSVVFVIAGMLVFVGAYHPADRVIEAAILLTLGFVPMGMKP